MNAKPEECECCGFQTDELKDYPHGRFREGKRWLCKLCAGTLTSVFAEYPEQQPPGTAPIMQAMCYIGNTIVAEIRKAKA